MKIYGKLLKEIKGDFYLHEKKAYEGQKIFTANIIIIISTCTRHYNIVVDGYSEIRFFCQNW